MKKEIKNLKINSLKSISSFFILATFLFFNFSAIGKSVDKYPSSVLVNAGTDLSIVLPVNTVALNGNASSIGGTITSVQWVKISGPSNFSISNPNIFNPTISGMDEGKYFFALNATDDLGGLASDTVTVTVSSRILIDLGGQFTASPDANGYVWNNVNSGTPGVKLTNALNIQNLVTNIGLEVINRIDGTFNPAGPGVNTANTIGAIGDYPATTTSDYAFSHNSTSNGQWKLTGLDSGTTYTVKFWGTRNGVADFRFIEIKRQEDTIWKTYNALNNTNPNNGASFIFTGKSDQIFDIRTGAASSFGHICLIDIQKTVNPSTPNLPPIAFAGTDLQLILPGNSATLDGSSSSDPDGTIVQYQWRKIQGPATYTISTPDAATTTITDVAEGVYQFELTVTDNNGATDRDTVTLQVGSRILIDFGARLVSSPDSIFNNYWNNVTDGTDGVKLADAITAGNTSSGISFEIVNRIDGTFNPSGPGANTGSLAGDVGDYPANATADYCFSHPSTTSGSWKFSGLDTAKVYSFKFWGSRSVPDPRIIEIKASYETTWQSYDASNNSNFNNAAYIVVTGRSEVDFDIRTGSTSPFGYINIVDINYTNTCNETTSITTDTACDSYTWNGNTYTTTGSYTFTTVNAAGCDSTATLNLIVNQSTGSNLTQTACDSYNWNETNYTTSGVYFFSTTNPSGCNNTDTLNLTINASSTSTQNQTACDAFTWNGNTYTTSGTYTFNTTNAAGCDSIATLILTINASSSSTESQIVCDGFIWNGNTYTTSGTYQFNTTNAIGCDSTATLILTINASTSSSETQSVCGSYTWNGNNYTTSGTYSFNTTNANGCDSTATLFLTINSSTSSSETQSACDSYSWNGNTYTTSGTYEFNTTNANGCDSMATLILTINASTSSSETQSACGSYSWNGNTYIASGTYEFNTTNAAGCDSTATLILTINASTSSSETQSACGSYTWNGNTYLASGTYEFNTTNANGCDSMATLILTINASTSSSEMQSACGSYTWNGNTYTASGNYEFNTTNAAGCDSTATLILTINSLTSSSETQSACGSYTWNGNTYLASGTYEFNTTNANGCDSTATLILTINASTSSSETQSACGSYTWNGNTYTASGNYEFNTTNAAGCDSTATLILTINTSTSSSETQSTCGSYTWNGNTYTTSGTYEFSTTNAAGCDSTATLILTINASASSSEAQSACGSYAWNGNTYTTSGSYEFNTTNAAGCDSTATLILTIGESSSSTELVTACDSYSWNSNTYTASGTYEFNTTNAAGCDSTATLILTINASTSSSETQSSCGSYAWNGNTYTASGTYEFNTTNAAGCDSTATLILTIGDGVQVNAGADQVIDLDAQATLAGNITGSVISFEWTGGTGTFNPGSTSLNTIYTPSASEITNGSVELYLSALSACGVVTDTIKITITNPTPVTLLDFRGVNTPQGNRLNWSTASEQNNAGFEIQRSIDGQRFATIGYVKSAALNGNSQQALAYQFLDASPVAGKNYYRLKQVDLDQKSSLSRVISLQVKHIALSISTMVFPNPTSNMVNLSIKSDMAGPIGGYVTDAQGKIMHRFTRNLTIGTQTIQWPVSSWAPGIYHIRFTDRNGIQQVQSFIKK